MGLRGLVPCPKNRNQLHIQCNLPHFGTRALSPCPMLSHRHRSIALLRGAGGRVFCSNDKLWCWVKRWVTAGVGLLSQRQDRFVGNRVGQGDRSLVPKNVTDVLDMLIVMFFWDKGPVPAVPLSHSQSPQSHFLILSPCSPTFSFSVPAVPLTHSP